MSLANLHTLQDSADLNSEFKQQRFAILKVLEGNVSTPYFDSKGIITIGIGFNIDVGLEKNRDKVMEAIGLSSVQQDNVSNTAWSSARMAEIKAMQQATTPQLSAKNAALRTYLNDALGAGQNFSMTDPQIKTVFDQLVLEHQDVISSLIGTPSLEQIVLTSLHYNSPALIGAGLKSALTLADANEARAEAWYQIRYAHVEGQNDKRRYAEAALFGLYGQGQDMSDEAARGVYRMYTKHSDKMIKHDKVYSNP